jgi:hypothetical protein
MSRTRILSGTACLLVLLTSAPAPAEIERLAFPGEKSMVFYWWPKVTPPKGWFRDEQLSQREGVNLHILDGETFDGSPAVMYTRAYSHEEGGTEQALADMIASDIREFRERDPAMKIDEVAPTVTGDGTKLRTFSFTPAGKGGYELVAYGREPKYVIMFCISTNSAELLSKHRPAFLALVRSYVSKDGD